MVNPLIKVLKFGGSSLGSVECLERVGAIIRGEAAACRPIVVVSALSGVTDMLERLIGACDTETIIGDIAERHITVAEHVLDYSRRYNYLRALGRTLDELRERCSQKQGELRTHAILATGELLSAPLLAGCLVKSGVVSQAVDGRSLIVSDGRHVDRELTRRRISSWFEDLSRFVLPVVSGFVAADRAGNTVTLGRGGSDYTASLLAESVGAGKLDRWTDVDGLYTGDPNKVAGAGKFLYLLLEDATAWNESSALGMHTEAFEPVLRACIPVHVRSTRYPQGDGTLIIPRMLPGRIQSDARRQLAHAAHRVVISTRSIKQPENQA